jgi:exodeoxyribonuclease V alpha subunit
MDQQAQPNQLDVEPLVTVEGVVERIVYENADSGFMVGRLRLDEWTESISFLGNLVALSEGETVRIVGRWVEDKKFGRQLRVQTLEMLVPTTLDGIEKYLGSGLIHGIGPAYAKRMVEAFGLETLRVIDEHPERLQQVPGIGAKRAVQIREAWASQRAIQSIMVFLQGHGITTSQAVKIYKQYGDTALTVLRQNPYRMAEDITGIGFRTADKIAGQLGMAKDAPERLQAGLLFVLKEAEAEGHVFLPEEELRAEAAELLGTGDEPLGAPLTELISQQLLVRETEALFLPRLYHAECECARLLKRLIATPFDPVSIRVDDAVRWVQKANAIELSPEQQAAVRTGVTAKVMVITGGPGTGKTTVVKSLLSILEKKNVSFLLAAPTGRAAKRLEAATGREARTIHRLIEYSPKKGGFARDENRPLNTDMVVIDETSMVDLPLMHSLLKALPPFARAVLVGDVDQLPSVGPGNILFDILASNVVPAVRLRTVFRQASQSGIVSNAHLINEGRFPQFNESDFFYIERREPERALDTVLELVSKRIPAKFGLDARRDIQVLAPMRRGDAGVARLNEAMQNALNPHGEPIPRRNFRCGDKVMQLRNNYDLEVYNGDAGIITRVDLEMNEVEVTFDDERVVLYALDELDNLGLCYATTVHKSQGCEYPAVVLLLLPQHYMMLQRNVLYTGITRGKRLVIIVGDAKAVGMAVRNTRITRRHTRLTERLRNEL